MGLQNPSLFVQRGFLLRGEDLRGLERGPIGWPSDMTHMSYSIGQHHRTLLTKRTSLTPSPESGFALGDPTKGARGLVVIPFGGMSRGLPTVAVPAPLVMGVGLPATALLAGRQGGDTVVPFADSRASLHLPQHHPRGLRGFCLPSVPIETRYPLPR